MQRGLKRKVRIVRARGRKPGRIEIEFYGIDDLTALAATLGAAARTHSAALLSPESTLSAADARR